MVEKKKLKDDNDYYDAANDPVVQALCAVLTTTIVAFFVFSFNLAAKNWLFDLVERLFY